MFKIELLKLSLILGLIIPLHSCKENELPSIKADDKLFVLLDKEYTNISFENTLVETSDENHLTNEDFVTGAGVAIGDINNDGLPDIYFSGNQVNDELYLNKGNFVFENISKKAGLIEDKTWSTGVTFGDVNSDGYLDIYVCKNTQGNKKLSANYLYINNGDATFTESAKVYKVANTGYSKQANFFDYNKDGYIDIYLVNQPPGIGNRIGGKDKYKDSRYSDKLYKNLGKTKGYIEVSAEAGTENMAHGLSAAIGDINNDGWPDIYVANDYDAPDYMYLNNQNGTFQEILKTSFKHISNFSMGSDIADYDNDGNLDIMVLDMVAEDHKRIKTNMGGMRPENFWKIVKEGGHYQYMFNTLQRNNGNGTFSDLAQMAGVSNTDWSWGPLIADYDNDGYKDIFVTNGIKRNMRNSDVNLKYKVILDSIEVEAKKQGKKFQELVNVLELAQMAPEDKIDNFIYKNNGDFTFSKKTKDWGINIPSLSNGAAYADLDNDGDLDLVVSNINQKAFVYRNTTTEKNLNNFLQLKLIPKKNTNLYCTRVKLYKDSKVWQIIEMSNTRGYMSKSQDIAHFGVGKNKEIEKIIVEWPNWEKTILENVDVNQQLEIVQSKSAKIIAETKEEPIKGLTFNTIAKEHGIEHKHQENEYNDYDKQVLLPHKMSQFGPSIAVADVNNDYLEDFYIGGAAENEGTLYIQNTNGTFKKSTSKPWSIDKASEDMGCVFFDVDNDSDMDLFVVSGGNEFAVNSKKLQDRIYINDGKGNFKKDVKRVPQNLISGSVVSKADYDNDGDIDLFIGGRLVPAKYPYPASSILLENVNGYLKDVTITKAKDLNKIGMVTSSTWVDINKDKKLDLVVVGEWMPIVTLIQNDTGEFVQKKYEAFKDLEGWYYKVTAADMDNDGDKDLVFGNLGLNYKYKASKKTPFQVHSYDFDKNSTTDIVLSYYEEGNIYPIRGRSCSIEQIPSLGEKFPTFESFGESTLEGIYGENLNKALHLKAKNFASIYAENLNGENFSITQLPMLAQIASVNAIVLEDFNKDGNKDILLAGNLFTSEIETPRNDSGIGLYLQGNGKGEFIPINVIESGFYTPNDVKDMKKIKIGSKNVVLVANNNYYLQAYTYPSLE
ncbi:VCBS repeat-containing protein [uncultured Maribacter sp.]|uniref:VCBS repeat-containing protein n=1 Tax=uncultured Maribacter sp. TaxID=431308 RepID=UPI0026207FEE|nr:VCBS repeat-containing protein [uncultured Maribacter sp.]